MNLGTIKTAVKRFGFDDSDPLLDWINAAYGEFNDSMENAPWLKGVASNTFAIGNPIVASPTDLLLPTALLYSTASQGKPWYPVEFKSTLMYELNEQPVETGPPCHWTTAGGGLFVTPNPDIAYFYTLYYDAFAVPLAADVDIPVIPSRYHYSLVQGAASIGLDAENQEDRSQTQRTKFTDTIDRAIAKYRTTQSGRFDRVRNVRY